MLVKTNVMIKTVNLTKKFFGRGKDGNVAAKIAVDHVSLDIAPNEFFGLLGKNGAGKTTLIRMLTMQLSPTAGEIFCDGLPLAGREREVKRMIGVVPQHINFDQELSVRENLELHGRLYGLAANERRRRIDELLEFMELSSCVGENVRRLSGGMKRRLLIARALVHRPRILFLDEPTVALDPQVRRRIWELLGNLAKDGVTVILTTHYIEEAQNLCRRVAVLNKGKLAAVNSPQALCDDLGNFTAEWENAGGGREYRFFRSREAAEDFVATFGDGVKIRPTDLEDVFIELTERKEA